MLILSSAALAQNDHVGTWRINIAKSKYSPSPAPKAGTLTISQSGASGVKIDAESTNADGTPTRIQYDAQFDGKDYPITGFPGADAVALKRIDDKVMEAQLKSKGAVVLTVRSTLSADGKTRTSTFKGKDPQGREVSNTVVYDRVK
jgi:hypothetical protein